MWTLNIFVKQKKKQNKIEFGIQEKKRTWYSNEVCPI